MAPLSLELFWRKKNYHVERRMRLSYLAQKKKRPIYGNIVTRRRHSRPYSEDVRHVGLALPVTVFLSVYHTLHNLSRRGRKQEIV
jgi:hypothetical protein